MGSDGSSPANTSGYGTGLALVDGFVIGTWRPAVADAKGMNRGGGQAYSHASLAQQPRFWQVFQTSSFQQTGLKL